VAFVEKVCQDAAAGVQQPNCRFVKRLTPITAFDKANVKGLEAVAKQVLAPHFHGLDQAGKKVSNTLIPCTASSQSYRAHYLLKTPIADILYCDSSPSGPLFETTRN
jgi:tRNA acetyltransferase TAN1